MLFKKNLPIRGVDANIQNMICGTPWHGLVNCTNPNNVQAHLKLADNTLLTYPISSSIQKGDFYAVKKPLHTFSRNQDELAVDLTRNHRWLDYGIVSGSSHLFYGKDLGSNRFPYLTQLNSYLVEFSQFPTFSNDNFVLNISVIKAFALGGATYTKALQINVPKTVIGSSLNQYSSVLAELVDFNEQGNKFIIGFYIGNNINNTYNVSSRNRKRVYDAYLIAELIGDEVNLAINNITYKDYQYCLQESKAPGPNLDSTEIAPGVAANLDMLLNYRKTLYFFIDKATNAVKEVYATLSGRYNRVERINYTFSDTTEDLGNGDTKSTLIEIYDGSNPSKRGNSYNNSAITNTLDKTTLNINAAYSVFIDTHKIHTESVNISSSYHYYHKRVAIISGGVETVLENTTTEDNTPISVTFNGSTVSGTNLRINKFWPINFAADTNDTAIFTFTICGGIFDFITVDSVANNHIYAITPNIYTNNVYGVIRSPMAHNLSSFSSINNSVVYTTDTDTNGFKTNLYTPGAGQLPDQAEFKPLYSFYNNSLVLLHSGKTDYFLNTQCTYNYRDNVGIYFKQSSVYFI